MLVLDQRLGAFAVLGRRIRKFLQVGAAQGAFADWEALLRRAEEANRWFTPVFQKRALQQWGESLRLENLEAWLSRYALSPHPPAKVLIVAAGNIPLVGFHDILSVLLTGNQALVKLSSKDAVWIPFLLQLLQQIEPGFEAYIEFCPEIARGFDAVIATGSDNSARYFEHYFSAYPTLLRKSRTSVALLDGSETPLELSGLADDVFRYYGMGCRNVTKLFLPKAYDHSALFKAFYRYAHVMENSKYANNYDYYKALYALNGDEIWENGFLLLREDKAYHSPVSVLFYEPYECEAALAQQLERDAEQLQLVVSKRIGSHSVGFGQTQQPGLWDYADGVDPLAFLIDLK